MIRIDCEKSCEFFQTIAASAYTLLGLSGEALTELIFLDEQEMCDLNRLQRSVNRVTDVLSFPSIERVADFTQANYPFEYDVSRGSVFIGSIVICSSVAKLQAEQFGHSEEREHGYLFLHGLLHLLGYDHETEPQKFAMREKEELILARVDLIR